MLKQADNQVLTQVGRGTPMRELMRRYWHHNFRAKTYHVSLYTFRTAPGTEAPKRERVPYRRVPLHDPDANWILMDEGRPLMNVYDGEEPTDPLPLPLEPVKFGQTKAPAYRRGEAGQSADADLIVATLNTWNQAPVGEAEPASVS